jgi:hypothetical protein
MMTQRTSNQNTAKLLVTALLASLLAAMPFDTAPASASTIAYNDGICDISTTSPNVYSIGSADELWEITDCSGAGETFVLLNDITVSDAVNVPTSSPIGTSDSSPIAFAGTLDGGGYSILGISISDTASDKGTGLFARLEHSTISNLVLSGRIVSGESNTGGLAGIGDGNIIIDSVTNSVEIIATNEYVSSFGGLLGYLDISGPLKIINSANTATISAQGDQVGGLVGIAASAVEISGTRNLGDVEGSEQVGGFVGSLDVDGLLSTISDSVNEGAITSGDISTGGFVGGSRHNLTAINSTNSGDVTSAGDYTGGILGTTTEPIKFQNVANIGDVRGIEDTGGLVGRSKEISFVNVSNAGLINGTDRTGGLVGHAREAVDFVNVSNAGLINGTDSTGGLVGHAKEAVEFVNVTNVGNITGVNYAAGLIGIVEGETTISDSVNSGTVTATGIILGGLIGVVLVGTRVQLEQTGNLGELVVTNGMTGGLVGLLDEGTLAISSSFNIGDITAGDGSVGGLLGEIGESNTALEIQNSFNSGNLETSQNVAGFVGYATDATITNSFNVGTIPATNNQIKDAILTGPTPAPLISSVYTNQSPSAYTQVSTDVELQDRETYVGWDFDTVWGFLCNENNGFPVLRWAHPGQSFVTTGCNGSEDNSQADNSQAEQVTPAPSYAGPTLERLSTPVATGAEATFSGSKLDLVSKVMIMSTEVVVVSLSPTSLTILVPSSLEADRYDLVLVSSFGTLTVIGALTVTTTVAEEQVPAQLLGWSWTLKYTGNSRTLNAAQEAAIQSNLARFQEATTVICWGYTTAANPNAWAIAHATARAKAACDLAVAIDSDLKTVVRLRYGVSKDFAMRAALQFWR